jgi:Fur family ferric uptake transcriptional regulator
MKSEDEIGKILLNHGLKQTQKRKEVLNLFYQHEHALSSKMIEQNFNSFDRVTLYRLLNSFEEKGLIHKVINEQGEAFYAKCLSCQDTHHHDNHIHFHCTSCTKIYCLEEINQASINIPEGFITHTVHLAVYGLCKGCSNK